MDRLLTSGPYRPSRPTICWRSFFLGAVVATIVIFGALRIRAHYRAPAVGGPNQMRALRFADQPSVELYSDFSRQLAP